MNRRDAVMAILALGAAPRASFAQPKGRLWRIGVLWEDAQSSPESGPQLDAFRAGLRALGYNEGKDYTFEQRYAQHDAGRLPVLAAELLALKVDLILSSGTPSAVAASKATRETPILIVTAADPVGTGLAATLSRPGGNVTGLTNRASDLVTKRLDLLRQVSPGVRRVGYLYDPDNGASVLGLKQLVSDCGKLGCTALPAAVRKPQDVAAAFDTLRRDKAQGLILTTARAFSAARDSIIEQAAKHRLPMIGAYGPYVDKGGLVSYGPDFFDLYRRAAGYADKIFRGAKPGDLAIEQPSVFELIINLKTAKALGIKIPQAVLIRADRVIE